MNNPGSGALLALLPGLFCGFPMLMIVIGALLPRYFARARQILATRPWRSFGLGLVNLFFFFALGALFSQSALDLLRLVAGLCVFVALPVIVVLGWATAAGLAGERILALVTERPTSPLVVLVIGLACLGVVALLPIIGWLALIVLVMAGFGAALLALFYPAESARGRPQDGLPSAARAIQKLEEVGHGPAHRHRVRHDPHVVGVHSLDRQRDPRPCSGGPGSAPRAPGHR